MVFGLFHVGAQPVAVGLFSSPWDKLAHGVYYSVLTVSGWIALGPRRPFSIAFAVITIAALDEINQLSLPGRSADWLDFLADVAACSVALLILHRRTHP